MVIETLVQIQIGGADIAIIGGEVFAVPLAPPCATTWVARMHLGKIRLVDHSAGFLLCARGNEPGARVIVQPSGFTVPVNQWVLTRYCDSAEGPVPVKEPSQLESGYYAMREPESGLYVYRCKDEDMSVQPKEVTLQPGDVGHGPLLFRVYR